VNTGLEYPEIQKFVKTFDNVRIVYPRHTFREVISEYGYPIIGKEVAERVCNARKCIDSGYKKYIEHYYQLTGQFPTQESRLKYEKQLKSGYMFTKYKSLLNVDFKISSVCCNFLKKSPIKKLNKKNITAQMAAESQLRTQKWLQHGCNLFDGKHPISNPMSFWRQQDVLRYIKINNLPIASVYGDIVEKDGQTSLFDTELCTTGCDRTGCIYCGFGAHLEKGEGRFQKLKRTHPRLWEYCIEGGGYDTDGLWKPNKQGLGLRHVFDTLNSIYGEDFIRYE
jgi:3'-phosphoadenosine 5'-phosphosulfate sulfotransferase (PAPS reductase)/FAD synthetase